MTIDEAIKILTKWKEDGEGDSVELEKAENLAIEALKVIEIHRTSGCLGLNFRLPGETKD